MLQFFCEFVLNNNLGLLANSHLINADRFGANCGKCIELAKVISVALDYPKKGYQVEFKKEYWAN
jgi:RNA-dependent RNA polymerase